MKVAELVRLLLRCNPAADVLLDNSAGEYNPSTVETIDVNHTHADEAGSVLIGADGTWMRYSAHAVRIYPPNSENVT